MRFGRYPLRLTRHMNSDLHAELARLLRPVCSRAFILIVWACLTSSCSSRSNNSTAGSDETTNHRTLKQRLGTFNIELLVHGEGSLQACELAVSEAGDTVRTQWEGDPVMKMETADLNGDALPEILIITQSAGSGSYGSVVGFTLRNDQGLVPIILPELSDDSVLSAGYMGHDRFSLNGRRLIRNFPLYFNDEENHAPSDTTRTIIYSLLPDKTAPRFRIEGAMLE